MTDAPAAVPRLAAPVAPGLTGVPEAGAEPRWMRLLFVALVLLYLVPIWSVGHVPTTDGPSHLYNAWVIVHLHDPHYPLFAHYYELDLSPIPNWFCYAALAGLLQVMPPLLVEKVFLSAMIVLLLSAVWYLAGSIQRERRWVAFLGFPFVYTLPFSFGFYNFCFSLVFYLFAVGLWWRRRERPNWRAALELNGVLILCYFSHIISLLVALATIGILWLSCCRRDRWRAHLWHLVILVPQLVLPLLWMAPHQGSPLGWSEVPIRQQINDFMNLDSLWTFLDGGQQPQKILAAAFALLILATLGQRLYRRTSPRDGVAAGHRWSAEDGFFVAALVLTVGYFVCPDGAVGGSFIKMRLMFYPFLIVLPWLAPGWRRAGRTLTVALLAALALFDVAVVWRTYRRVDPLVSAFVESVDLVPADRRIMPLYWGHDGFGQRPGIVGHTVDYVALEKGLIDWDNYEAISGLFPVHFKQDLYHANTMTMEATPEGLAVADASEWVDYILTWRLPPKSPINASLAPYYERTFKLDVLQIYGRRSGGGVP
jgi:hypothetical protein